jgi:hypothetical protein
MTTTREKVAPWERYTDGDWHTVRTGPADEIKAESLRQYRRHYESMRAWCAINRMRGQLSRTDSGRVLRVRLRPDERQIDRDRIAGSLRGRGRTELGVTLIEATQIIQYARHLRQYGENGPGETASWREFDARSERFIRSLGRIAR